MTFPLKYYATFLKETICYLIEGHGNEREKIEALVELWWNGDYDLELFREIASTSDLIDLLRYVQSYPQSERSWRTFVYRDFP